MFATYVLIQVTLLCYLYEFKVLRAVTQGYNDDYMIFCYTAHDISWNFGNEYCSNYFNADMATFHNETQVNSFVDLRNRLGLSSKKIWFGLHISNASSNWTFTDESNYDYINWHDDFPHSPDINPCSYADDDATASWRNSQCTTNSLECFACNTPNFLQSQNTNTDGDERVYKASFSVTVLNSSDTFYIGIVGAKNDTPGTFDMMTLNKLAHWVEYRGFYESYSTYPIYATTSKNDGNISKIIIIATGTDTLKLENVKVDDEMVNFTDINVNNEEIKIEFANGVLDGGCQFSIIDFINGDYIQGATPSYCLFDISTVDLDSATTNTPTTTTTPTTITTKRITTTEQTTLLSTTNVRLNSVSSTRSTRSTRSGTANDTYTRVVVSRANETNNNNKDLSSPNNNSSSSSDFFLMLIVLVIVTFCFIFVLMMIYLIRQHKLVNQMKYENERLARRFRQSIIASKSPTDDMCGIDIGYGIEHSNMHIGTLTNRSSINLASPSPPKINLSRVLSSDSSVETGDTSVRGVHRGASGTGIGINGNGNGNGNCSADVSRSQIVRINYNERERDYSDYTTTRGNSLPHKRLSSVKFGIIMDDVAHDVSNDPSTDPSGDLNSRNSRDAIGDSSNEVVANVNGGSGGNGNAIGMNSNSAVIHINNNNSSNNNNNKSHCHYNSNSNVYSHINHIMLNANLGLKQNSTHSINSINSVNSAHSAHSSNSYNINMNNNNNNGNTNINEIDSVNNNSINQYSNIANDSGSLKENCKFQVRNEYKTYRYGVECGEDNKDVENSQVSDWEKINIINSADDIDSYCCNVGDLPVGSLRDLDVYSVNDQNEGEDYRARDEYLAREMATAALQTPQQTNNHKGLATNHKRPRVASDRSIKTIKTTNHTAPALGEHYEIKESEIREAESKAKVQAKAAKTNAPIKPLFKDELKNAGKGLAFLQNNVIVQMSQDSDTKR